MAGKKIMICTLVKSVLLFTVCGVAFLSTSGCGPKRPETYPVSGRVTFKGKPVVQGLVSFYPENGRMATGNIGPDGRYCLMTYEPNDGTVPGRHRVSIDSKKIPPEMLNPPKSLKDEARGGGPPRARIEWLVPKKYSRPETSQLTAEVTSGDNIIDLNLP